MSEHVMLTNLMCTYCGVCGKVDPVKGEPCGDTGPSYAELRAKLEEQTKRAEKAESVSNKLRDAVIKEMAENIAHLVEAAKLTAKMEAMTQERADRMTAQARVAELAQRLQVTVEKLARLQAFVDTSQWKRDLTTVERERDGARQQLTEAQRELEQWRSGGITEELLRKQDGHLKLGNGCVIVIESEFDQLQATVTEELLRKQDGCIKVGHGCLIVREDEWRSMLGLRESLEGVQARLAASEQRVQELEVAMQRTEVLTHAVSDEAGWETAKRFEKLYDEARGTIAWMAHPKISTRCPSCKSSTLFIASGDRLTCSLIGCKDPTLITSIGALYSVACDERDQLKATVTAQLAEMGRLKLALSYLAGLGGGNSEGNYFAKAALQKEVRPLALASENEGA
mgnify:FL=1